MFTARLDEQEEDVEDAEVVLTWESCGGSGEGISLRVSFVYAGTGPTGPSGLAR